MRPARARDTRRQRPAGHYSLCGPRCGRSEDRTDRVGVRAGLRPVGQGDLPCAPSAAACVCQCMLLGHDLRPRGDAQADDRTRAGVLRARHSEHFIGAGWAVDDAPRRGMRALVLCSALRSTRASRLYLRFPDTDDRPSAESSARAHLRGRSDIFEAGAPISITATRPTGCSPTRTCRRRARQRRQRETLRPSLSRCPMRPQRQSAQEIRP